MSVVHPEGRLLDVSLVHLHLVVAAAHIKFGEEARTAEFIHHRNWERFVDRLSVEGPVIDTKPPRTLVFLDQQHRRRER
jgi:hypothetical protein